MNKSISTVLLLAPDDIWRAVDLQGGDFVDLQGEFRQICTRVWVGPPVLCAFKWCCKERELQQPLYFFAQSNESDQLKSIESMLHMINGANSFHNAVGLTVELLQKPSIIWQSNGMQKSSIFHACYTLPGPTDSIRTVSISLSSEERTSEIHLQKSLSQSNCHSQNHTFYPLHSPLVFSLHEEPGKTFLIQRKLYIYPFESRLQKGFQKFSFQLSALKSVWFSLIQFRICRALKLTSTSI